MKKDDKDIVGPKLNSLEESTPELKEELSSIAASPKQKFLIWSILGLIGSYLLFYYFVFKKTPPGNTTITDNGIASNTNVAKPAQISDDIPVIPQLPSIPKLYEPPPPPPPPPQPTTTIVKVVPEVLPAPTMPNNSSKSDIILPAKIEALASNISTSEEEKKRLEAKRRSGIMYMSGKPVTKTPEQEQQEADFIKRGDAGLLLPRGKVIDAVIETAINSDFGGEVKAIVSRDVYAASGKSILIPKGSTVFGKYSTGFQQSYARIDVEWFRIDLAHSNFGINISSASIDNLGRGGVAGNMDNRYKEKIANVVLSSAFNIMLASALDKMVPPVINSLIGGSGNQASATQINSIATNIFSDGSQSPIQKINAICSQVQGTIYDKTSAAYVTFAAACTNAIADVATNPGNATTDLNALMTAVYNASASMVTSGGFVNPQVMTTPTQKQQASKQAFTEIGNTVKEIVVQQLPKATVTIDQGTRIKIYVNKDYNFPKSAIHKLTNVHCQ